MIMRHYRLTTSTPATSGYSLVEVLVAISVLLIALVGPLTIAYQGLKSVNLARNTNTAFFLAQEGVELVVLQRENAALQHYTNTSEPPWMGNAAYLDGSFCTAGAPCAIDSHNPTLRTCGDGCRLYQHTTPVGTYRHQSNDSPTQFTRAIVLTPSGSEVVVSSTVRWGDAAEEVVELQTTLYNIYDI